MGWFSGWVHMKDYSLLVTNTNGSTFPNTEAVNASGPTATDGTEFVKAFIDDQWGANQAVMSDAGLIPNGIQESSAASQRLSALKFLGYNTYTSGMSLKAGTLIMCPSSSMRLVCIVNTTTIASNILTDLGDFAEDIRTGVISPVQSGIVVSNTVLNVGAGLDFTTASNAILFCSNFYARNGVTVNILLSTGYLWAEQLSVNGIDLRFVNISSVDATVTISRTALSVASTTGQGYAAFELIGANLGTCNIAFDMDANGTATNRVGYIIHSSSIKFTTGKGCINAYDNIIILAGSSVIIDGGLFSGAIRDGIRCLFTSTVSALQTLANTCGGNGITATGSVIMSASGCSTTGCTQYGIYSSELSQVDAQNSFSSGTTYAYFVADGGVINSKNAQASAAANVAVNTFTSSGFIYQ